MEISACTCKWWCYVIQWLAADCCRSFCRRCSQRFVLERRACDYICQPCSNNMPWFLIFSLFWSFVGLPCYCGFWDFLYIISCIVLVMNGNIFWEKKKLFLSYYEFIIIMKQLHNSIFDTMLDKRQENDNFCLLAWSTI